MTNMARLFMGNWSSSAQSGRAKLIPAKDSSATNGRHIGLKYKIERRGV